MENIGYLRLVDGVPEEYSLPQLRADNKNISFPEQMPDEALVEFGVFPFKDGAIPTYNPLVETISESGFEEVDGKWVRAFVAVKLPEEIASENVRSKRNQLLSDTDWIVISSYEKGLPVPESWSLYRQQLRDVTSQPLFPYDVVWPVKPG